MTAIREAAPNAEVWVVAYPRLLPQSGTCSAIGFAKGDVVWGNHIENRLNTSLSRGSLSAGGHYVAMFPASKGHDACAGSDAWINGRLGILAGPHAAAGFHPLQSRDPRCGA